MSQIFKTKNTVYSFEIFPPKRTSPVDTVLDTLDRLEGLNPDFISVTYGAGGNPADRSTCEIASLIKNKYKIESVAHLTCARNSRGVT